MFRGWFEVGVILLALLFAAYIGFAVGRYGGSRQQYWEGLLAGWEDCNFRKESSTAPRSFRRYRIDQRRPTTGASPALVTFSGY